MEGKCSGMVKTGCGFFKLESIKINTVSKVLYTEEVAQK